MEPDLHLKSYSEQYPRNCQQIDFSPNIVLVEATKASVNEKSPTTAGGKMDAFFYDTTRWDWPWTGSFVNMLSIPWDLNPSTKFW